MRFGKVYGNWLSKLLLRKHQWDVKRLNRDTIDAKLLYVMTIGFKGKIFGHSDKAQMVDQYYKSMCDRMFGGSLRNKNIIQRKPYVLAFLDRAGSRSGLLLDGYDHYHCIILLKPNTLLNFNMFLSSLRREKRGFYDSFCHHRISALKQVHVTAYNAKAASIPALVGYCSKLQGMEEYSSRNFSEFEMFCLPNASDRRLYPFYANVDARNLALRVKKVHSPS